MSRESASNRGAASLGSAALGFFSRIAASASIAAIVTGVREPSIAFPSGPIDSVLPSRPRARAQSAAVSGSGSVSAAVRVASDASCGRRASA